MTPEERQKRREKVSEAAREAVAQRGEITIKLSPDNIKSLMDISNKQKKPLGEVASSVLEDYISKNKDISTTDAKKERREHIKGRLECCGEFEFESTEAEQEAASIVVDAEKRIVTLKNGSKITFPDPNAKVRGIDDNKICVNGELIVDGKDISQTKKQWQSESLREDIKQASDEVASWPAWMQQIKPQNENEDKNTNDA